ncbi:type II toxin-antitoxin system HicB family antitoxin [Bartonella sp. DGB1]|uniref:type II toxin-antitoxin system HicB family antitoxin n=1 Tax=Bartonella sp. DGB1 TaxID=3239807 RepID=UPI003523D986
MLFCRESTFEDTVVEAYSALKAHFQLLVDENLDIPLHKSISNYLNDKDCNGGIWASVNIDVSKFDKHAKRIPIT